MQALVQQVPDEGKARDFVLESLDCVEFHTLSRKLLDQLQTAHGPVMAIVPPWINLDKLPAYNQDPGGANGQYEEGCFPQDRLAGLIQEYFKATPGGVGVCESWGWDRRCTQWPDIKDPWFPPRLACFGDDEVYHFVLPGHTFDQIQEGVIARAYWQTGTLSVCRQVPEADIPDESFFDEIVRNVKHVFVPAFDGGGYLIWTPDIEGRCRAQ